MQGRAMPARAMAAVWQVTFWMRRLVSLIQLPYWRRQVSVLYTPRCTVGVMVRMSKLYLSVGILADGKGSRRNLKKATKAGSMLLQRNGWVHSTNISDQPRRWSMGELVRLAVWTSQTPQTESEELTWDTLVSHTGNRKSLVPTRWLRKPAWDVTSPTEPATNLAHVKGSILQARAAWQTVLETSLPCICIWNVHMYACISFRTAH